MVLKRWATRHLRSGDLSALAALARTGAKPHNVSLQRLSRRRFVATVPGGITGVTLRGQVALLVRRAMDS